MSNLQQRLRSIEEEIHTLETATPRNSATVDRGGLDVVDEGSIILESGGTIFFGEGGSAISANYDMEYQTGWQIGTERRGTSVVVLNDAPGENLQVTTANSSVEYEEIEVPAQEVTVVPLGSSSSLIIQMFTIREERDTVVVSGHDVSPTRVFKEQKEQWAYSYMGNFSDDVHIYTDMEDLTVRSVKLTVNNAS